MKLLFELLNKEDFHYLESFDESKRDEILRTAISIGFKSIQMSEVNMDCHSYFDPLKDIIEKNSTSGEEKAVILNHLLGMDISDIPHEYKQELKNKLG